MSDEAGSEILNETLPPEGQGREELRQLYEWDLESALAAQEEWSKHKDHPKYAAGPLHRWVAAQDLLALFEIYWENDKPKEAILEALYLCSYRSLPIPKWCSMAYLKAYREVRHYRAKSWDDVFGKPHPKGTHLPAKRQSWEKRLLVYWRIKEIKETDPDIPIDGYLFERIGREFAIGGKTLTEEYYYSAKKFLENLPHRDLVKDILRPHSLKCVPE